ncbi:endolytic transglycosylase MltG [Sabulicella rubraurantiaca]|uniref:endolytic transglycosylase MltG n=1 Tax=Sabulicella rubraurantiaca TaxID=2811429 RepID=UPI001A9601C2|nr:endolytic transglycosylase MltG [Sabulicella rubraurantiaca]
MRRFLKLMVVGCALLAVAGGAAAWFAWREASAPGPLAEPANIVIPRGGVEAIATTLAERGAVESPRLFALAALATRGEGPLRAAEFSIPAGASIRDILSILRQGRPVQRRLTIAEGLTARQVASLLERTEGLSGEVPTINEGALLPETYSFTLNDSRAALVRRATTAMDAALEEAWKDRAPNLPLNSAREALILASIVERETGVAAERGLVAGVFINRLRRGMPLQSDPTVAYGAGNGMPLDRPLTRADLDQPHPYNTYRNRGLPPGPIAMPGRASIEAVLRPEATEFIYFVADGTGGHAFARTLEEHNRNVARWRALNR